MAEGTPQEFVGALLPTMFSKTMPRETVDVNGDAHPTGELLDRLFVAPLLMPPSRVDLTDPDEARTLARELIAALVIGQT